MTVTLSVVSPSTTGTYYWNFKNGGFGQTTTANPTTPTTFSTPNTYLVEVSETNGGSAKYTITIKVFTKPTLLLTAIPQKGCVPLNVAFNITPTVPVGVIINNYTWDFGDGYGNSLGTTSEPHIYNSPGVFDIAVGIETNFPSCNQTPKFPAAVSCSALPIADFIPNPSSGCAAPLTVSFTNSSSSPSGALPLTYEWNLGSGIINTTIPSPITYSVTGSYSVSLTATDANNCKGNTTTQTISIGTPISDFTLPDTVCINVANTITNISTAGFSNWVFDAFTSPTSSGATNPTVNFSVQGPHTITLTTTSFSGTCSDTKTKTIFVEVPTATFTTTPTYSCNSKQTVNFAASSPNNIASWNWAFDSTHHQTGQIINYTFVSLPGVKGKSVFTTTLTATTQNGCTSPPFLLNDTLDKPSASFKMSTDRGCVPLTVTFSDSSFSDETITQWEWDYGDGSLKESGNSTHPHTFVDSGVFRVSLIITNNKGCKDTTYQTVKVGTKYPISITANPLIVCPLDIVNFTNTTANKSAFDTWQWIGDNGFFNHIPTGPTDTTASWRFQHSIGKQLVVLRGTHKGCPSLDTVSVFVKNAIAIFNFKQDCLTPFDVVFTDRSLGATSLSWNFGDGSLLSDTSGTFTHTYPTGAYTVTLTASNDTSGCPDFDTTATFRIYKIKADFTSPTNLCKGQTYAFDASASQNNAPSYFRAPPGIPPIPGPSGYGGFYWMYSDLTKKPDTLSSYLPVLHTDFNTPGNQTVSLIVWDPSGCSDTLSKRIKVYDIKAQYTVSDTAICFPAPAEIFTDHSTSPDTLITNWKWTFGDGTPTYTLSTTSPSLTYTYTAGATPDFITKLVITNKLGCTDSVTTTITTYTPTSTASAVASNVCSGTPVTFSGTPFNSQGSSLQFDWFFDDGSVPVLDSNNVPHTYTTSGTYTTTLNFTEITSGCSGSTTTNVHVQNYPTALFIAKNNRGDTLQNNGIVCFDNPQVFLTSKSTSDIFSLPLTNQWDLSRGFFVTTLPDTFATKTFFTKGVQILRLKSSTSYNCQNITTMTLNVVGPAGDFSVSKTNLCKGDSVTLKLKETDTTDIVNYSWDWRDGTPFIANTDPVTHTYKYIPSTGAFGALLNLSGLNGVCPITVEHTIFIYDVKSDFSVNGGLDSAVCLGQGDTLANLSSSFANSFVWDFGDGTPNFNTASKSTFYHTYTAPGSYNIKLTVSNTLYGCHDDTTETVSVDTLPIIAAVGDTICRDHRVSLSSTNNPFFTYAWTPKNELNNATIYNPNLIGSESETFTVTVTDMNTCVNSATAFLYVVQPLTNINFDTTIVIGDTIKLPFTKQNDMVEFAWTPETGLSCTDCPYPKVHPLDDITYSVLMKDTCTTAKGTFVIHVRPEMFLQLPTTFTPNGDGTNDIIYVKGWGIKDLLSFEIYNRWGELVFTTSELSEGWNGYYKGMLQNSDTYIWKVKAVTWRNTTLAKEGHFNLMR